MTPVWLLPVVTLIVASSTGGVLTPYLYKISPAHALLTATTCVFLVSIGLSLALMILTVYLYRLITHGPPPGSNILSSFIPLGPTGQSGFAILLIGQAFKEILPYTNAGDSGILASEMAGEIVWTVCVGLSFVLWSLATMWLGIACLGLQHVLRKKRFPFKLPFWGMIFPNVCRPFHTSSTFSDLNFRNWLAILTIFDGYAGSLRKSNNSARHSLRLILLPYMGCYLRCCHPLSLDLRLHTDNIVSEEWADIRGALCPGDGFIGAERWEDAGYAFARC